MPMILDSALFNLIVVFCDSSIQVPPSLSFSFIICRIFAKMYNFREKIFAFSYVKIN